MQRKRLSAPALCCMICLAAGLQHELLGAEGWWNGQWQCRRRVTAFGQIDAPGPDICYVEFFTGGYAKKDGSDLRVVEHGRVVPHQVIFAGPGDFVKLVIKMDRAAKKSRTFHVYYGNPQAKPLKHTLDIRRGLLMEVRHYKGGGCANWGQMQRTLEKSEGHVMGAGFVKNIHHGHNPFGPSENCVSIYRGWFKCRQKGTYFFATTSDDASFMFIDGKLTVQWPGIHRAVPFAHKRMQKALPLTAGFHKLEYYHLQLGARHIAVAAWAPPGARAWRNKKYKRFEVIPEKVFPKVILGRAGPYERADKKTCPDFTAAKKGETYLHGKPIVRMAFLDCTQPRPVTRKTTRWDWGDGNEGEGTGTEHVYFTPGLYKVTMTVEHRGKRYSVSQVVDAFQDWNKQIERKIDPLAEYCPRVSKYRFARMKAPDLLVAARYFEKIEKWPELAKASAAIVARGKDFSDDDLHARSVLYAQVLSQRFRKHRDAVLALAKAEECATAAPYKARLALAAGDIAVKSWRNPEQAFGHYQRVLSRYRDTGSDVKRRALVGLGDAYRQQGEYEKASDKYEAAMLIPVSGQPYHKLAVRVGTLARAIEYYIQRSRVPRDRDEAASMLDTWEWEYPTQKLIGHSTLLRAKLAYRLKHYDEAIAELEEFIGVNPKSHYAGESLIVLAESYFAKRDVKKAKNALETLISDYRDSDQVDKAKTMLEKYSKTVPPPPAKRKQKKPRKRK